MTTGYPQPPGHRTGEGTQGLWELIRDDMLRKNPRPQDQRGSDSQDDESQPDDGEPRFRDSGWGYGIPALA